jgi:hypothetical protein
MHEFSQTLSPARQHARPEHMPDAHTMPHPPQFITVLVGVQTLPQFACPAGHAHTPATQD